MISGETTIATPTETKSHRRNNEIRVPRVRVIDAEGQQLGILGRDEALRLAQEAELDLVEIQPTADPPVCRIMDFGKFRFEQQKKAQAAKKKQKQVEIKELKFRPTTDVGDYQIKMRNLLRFLDGGDRKAALSVLPTSVHDPSWRIELAMVRENGGLRHPVTPPSNPTAPMQNGSPQAAV